MTDLPENLNMSDPTAERLWEVAQAVERHPDIDGWTPRSLANWEFEEWEKLIRGILRYMKVSLVSFEEESAVAALVVAMRTATYKPDTEPEDEVRATQISPAMLGEMQSFSEAAERVTPVPVPDDEHEYYLHGDDPQTTGRVVKRGGEVLRERDVSNRWTVRRTLHGVKWLTNGTDRIALSEATTLSYEDVADALNGPTTPPMSVFKTPHVYVAGPPCRVCGLAEQATVHSVGSTMPIAWVSEDGLHNIREARERGSSHYSVQIRIDRNDDYNTVPLYANGPTTTELSKDVDPMAWAKVDEAHDGYEFPEDDDDGPTTTTALPDVDQVYSALDPKIGEYTTRGQIQAVIDAVAALLGQTTTDEHPHGGPSRLALMKRNGELRAGVERVVADMTEHLDDSYAGQSTDHRLRDIVRWRDALAALNGPTTTTAEPDADAIYDYLDVELGRRRPRESPVNTYRIQQVLDARAALLGQTDTEDET